MKTTDDLLVWLKNHHYYRGYRDLQRMLSDKSYARHVDLNRNPWRTLRLLVGEAFLWNRSDFGWEYWQKIADDILLWEGRHRVKNNAVKNSHNGK